MGLEIKKIDYSKFKGKSIAVISDMEKGIIFADYLRNSTGMDIELYKLDFTKNFLELKCLIRELNNDDDILLIAVMGAGTNEILVKHEKRFIYRDLGYTDIDSMLRVNNINTNNLLSRLDAMIK